MFSVVLVIAVMLCLQTTNASAPPGRYTIKSATVKDNQTGLTWQREADSAAYSQAGGQSYCAGLNLGGFSSGWRLPTRAELLSIVDATVYNPAVDAIAFPNTSVDAFWTSSPDARSALSAWVVYFHKGSSGTSPPSSLHLVRCVRSGA
jgi:hypothetical protein